MEKKETIIHDTNKMQLFEDYYSAFGNMAQLNLCKRFFSKEENKTLEASVTVLQYMIENYLKKEFDRSALLEIFPKNSEPSDNAQEDTEDDAEKSKKKKTTGQPSAQEVLLRDALKILRCHKLVHFEKGIYKLNRELWNKGVDFGIDNRQLLSDLAPALVRHLRYEVRKTPNDFFQMTSDVIGYALRDSDQYNNEYGQTYHVFWQMEQGKTVLLSIDDTVEEVIPLEVSIDQDGEKVFRYKYQESDDIFMATLDQIVIPSEGI